MAFAPVSDRHNKGNADSIAIYRKSGFVVHEEAVFDIGNGHVMEKRL